MSSEKAANSKVKPIYQSETRWPPGAYRTIMKQTVDDLCPIGNKRLRLEALVQQKYTFLVMNRELGSTFNPLD